MTEALAATGQDQPPPPDQRSPAQRLHDTRMGVTPRTADQYSDVPDAYRQFCAELLLPQDLARVIVDDALSGGEKDAAVMLGDKYSETLKAAQAALDRAAHLPDAAKIKASDLSAFALAQLAIWEKHRQRHAASRPH